MESNKNEPERPVPPPGYRPAGAVSNNLAHEAIPPDTRFQEVGPSDLGRVSQAPMGPVHTDARYDASTKTHHVSVSLMSVDTKLTDVKRDQCDNPSVCVCKLETDTGKPTYPATLIESVVCAPILRGDQAFRHVVVFLGNTLLDVADVRIVNE